MRLPPAMLLPACAALAATDARAQALAGRDGGGQPERAPIRRFQPPGPFPGNPLTNLPFAGPEANSDEQRRTVAALRGALVELQQPVSQTKQAHWDVSGTLWHSLHGLLQEHYEGISAIADRVAERMLAIGSAAGERPTTLAQRSAIPDSRPVSWTLHR